MEGAGDRTGVFIFPLWFCFLCFCSVTVIFLCLFSVFFSLDLLKKIFPYLTGVLVYQKALIIRFLTLQHALGIQPWFNEARILTSVCGPIIF